MGLENSDPLAHSTYVGAKQVDWKADGLHHERFAYLTKSGSRVFGFCPAGSTCEADLTTESQQMVGPLNRVLDAHAFQEVCVI